MYLYLIQHGEAKSKEEDPERGLNDQGTANAKKSATFFKQLGKEITTIWHSGKKRAEQTADILAESLGVGDRVEKCGGLAPNDDVSIIKKQIEKEKKNSIAVVGHLPHLSRLASALLTGNQDQEIIQFRNAGIVCLSNEKQNWILEWAVPPFLL